MGTVFGTRYTKSVCVLLQLRAEPGPGDSFHRQTRLFLTSHLSESDADWRPRDVRGSQGQAWRRLEPRRLETRETDVPLALSFTEQIFKAVKFDNGRKKRGKAQIHTLQVLPCMVRNREKGQDSLIQRQVEPREESAPREKPSMWVSGRLRGQDLPERRGMAHPGHPEDYRTGSFNWTTDKSPVCPLFYRWGN